MAEHRSEAERDGGVVAHRVWVEAVPGAGRAEIVGDEAHHAVRVKRIGVGEAVELFDGRGMLNRGVVAEAAGGKNPVLTVHVGGPAQRVEPVRPRIEVWCPAPKGERAEWMIDQLSQVGASAWRALRTERTQGDAVVRRADRLERAAVESAKQCGRAWMVEVDAEPVGLDAASAETRGAAGRDPGAWVCVADGSGPGLSQADGVAARDAGRVVLVLGPEGGLTREEIATCARAGAVVRSFGPHVMRIETAAVVSAAGVRHAGAGQA
jgi:16S rRNA (uracil1498-N3)-methyltransferase